ncbi:MAG TPA: hypothetical protein VF163_16805, partial [Micromonosporaceae bacterium]
MTGQAAMACWSVAVRVAAPADPGHVAAWLMQAMGHEPVPVIPGAPAVLAVPEIPAVLAVPEIPAVWTEDVPADADSPTAWAWLDRELNRPVAPEIGPAVRAVLLRYADGQCDLVVVGHHGWDQQSAIAPEWGSDGATAGWLGDPAVATCEAALDPTRPAGFDTAPTARVAAAAALVLARFEGRPAVRLAVGLPPRPVDLEVDL